MTESILALPDRPTALFAVNNFIAIGALRALRDADLRIPEDMALVGFDDLPLALVVEPFLTVAAQPAYEMGARATDLLLTRIRGDGAEAPIEVILPTELIVRRSSGVGITTAVGG
jgi:LacI family transcriptional regulator